MSRAWPAAAFVRRRFRRSGPRRWRARSWLSRHEVAFLSAAPDATSGSASAAAQTVDADADGAPVAMTAIRREAGDTRRRARIYPPYRVKTYPTLVPEESPQRIVQVAGALDLRHVAAAQQHVLGVRHGLAHVACERGRDQAVVGAPDEHRRHAQLAQPRP